MGLDMYAFAVDRAQVENPDAQTDLELVEDAKPEEIFYWRKHHDLHGWMKDRYDAKGGRDKSFNCNTLRLTEQDLLDLEAAVKARSLPSTTGFFFGNNPPCADSDAEDMQFVEAARKALAEGKVVFYDSWW